MSWRRLMGRAFLSKNSELHPTSKFVSRNHCGFKSIQASLCTHFGENPECNNHEVEEKSKRGLDSYLMIQTADCAEKKKNVEKQTGKQAEEKLMKIRNGDMINLFNFLFTKERDYLVKYNNQQIKADQLAGKVIAVYFMPLPPHYLEERMSTIFLMDTYNYLMPRTGFEVVLVPYECDLRYYSPKKQNPEKEFDDLISRTPWPAIPFSDKTTINHLRRRFGIDGFNFPSTFVIDSTGMVLQAHSEYILNTYGGLGYPFSDEKIELLKLQDEAVAKNPSVKTLLASPDRDYVISNKRNKVPICTLDEKVVALYFYVEGHTPFTQDLKVAYEELTKDKKKFEVVLVYVYDTEETCNCTSEESFWKTFKTMPWLALPFRDPNYRTLKRFFCYPFDRRDGLQKVPQLVICGPHGEFIEPWGDDILLKFKSPAYPFTRDKVVKLEIEKVKDLRLEMLWDQNTVFKRKDGSEVQFSSLSGKRIICFFYGEEVESVKLLKERYQKARNTDDEFEVIYILDGEDESATYNELVADVPWLLSCTTEMIPGSRRSYCCYEWSTGNDSYMLCSLLAFDQDGRLVRKYLPPKLMFDDTDFPFYGGGMENETFLQLNGFHEWNQWDMYYQGLNINSIFKNVTIREPGLR